MKIKTNLLNNEIEYKNQLKLELLNKDEKIMK